MQGPTSGEALLAFGVGFLWVSTLRSPDPAPPAALLPAGFGPTRTHDPDRMSLRDLQRLPAIGPVRARAIVEARHASGLHGAPEAWKALPGIGEETVRSAEAALGRSRETVGGP